MRILVVDDSKVIRDSLTELISKIPGVTAVGQAQDIREGEKFLRKTTPEIVILDIRMPSGNGMGLLKKIKNLYPGMVVIMFTDYPNGLYREKSMELGADYFFEKSTESEKLVIVLRDLVKNIES